MRYLLILLLSLNLTHAGIGDYFKKIADPDAIKEKIKDEIKNLEIKTKVKLIDGDVIDGVGLGIQYRYELEPSYKAGFYTRADRWQFGGQLDPLKLIRAVDFPISLRFNPGVEIYYVRQFKSQAKAATALPYTPARLPLTAKKAVDNLKPGDFVAIPTHLNMVLSAGMAAGSHGVEFGASTHFILSGEFMVHMFRLAEDKMRVKIIATRSKQAGGSVGAKFDLDVFGVSLVESAIKKIFEIDIAKFSANMKWGDLFMLDYVLDLKNAEARAAYNRVMASTLTFKNLTVANPFAKNKDLEDQIVTDLTLLETIRKEDVNKEVKRVERLFRGKNAYTQKSTKFKMGLLLAKYERRKIFTKNHIVSYDQQDVARHFGFNNFSFWRGHKMFWGLFKKDLVFSASTLMPLNAEGNSTGFSDLGVSLDLRDKRFLYGEVWDARRHTERQLTLEVYNQVDFGTFNKIKFWQRVDNARIFHQIFFHEAAVRSYFAMPINDLRQKMENYCSTIPMPLVNQNGNGNGSQDPNWKAWLKRYRSQINTFLGRLEQAFRPEGATDGEKFANFERHIMALKDNRPFQTFGTGFLISLLPEAARKKLVHINLAWDARNMKPVRFSFGTNSKTEMYKNLEYIQSVLNNRGFDLRLIENQRKMAKEHAIQKRQKQQFHLLHKIQ